MENDQVDIYLVVLPWNEHVKDEGELHQNSKASNVSSIGHELRKGKVGLERTN